MWQENIEKMFKECINSRMRIINPFVREVQKGFEEIKSVLDVELMRDSRFDDHYRRDLESLQSYIHQDTQKKSQEYYRALGFLK